jgi:hypothetical protein
VSSADALIDETLAAHGGFDRWSRLDSISARVRAGGLLARTRMSGVRFAEFELTARPRERWGAMGPFPEPGRRGVFDAGAVRIESDSGEVLAARDHPRPLFFGRSGLRRNLRWDPLDAIYFAGYALWAYLSFPLLLRMPGFEVRAGPEWSGGGEPWRSLRVRFPEGVDAHSAEQTFWIGADGLLRRNDYTAEIVGRWARGAHLTESFADVGGLLVPTRRRVMPRRRNLTARRWPVLVALDLDELEVSFEPDLEPGANTP